MNEPQLPLPQVTVQSTPALDPSLATLAYRFAVVLTGMIVGGVWENETWMDEELIATKAETCVDEESAAVALMVTAPPAGTLEGAV